MARRPAGCIVCISLSLLLAMALPAAAEEPRTIPDEAERLMGEGLSSLLQALDLLLKTVPQYAAPEVLPNGDIILRRLHPEAAPPATPDTPPESDPDATET